MNRIERIASRITATGASIRLRWDQVERILKASGLSDKDFEDAGNVGLYQVEHVILPTGAKIVRKSLSRGKASFFLSVAGDLPNYHEVLSQHVKETGGLGGGYGIGFMV